MVQGEKDYREHRLVYGAVRKDLGNTGRVLHSTRSLALVTFRSVSPPGLRVALGLALQTHDGVLICSVCSLLVALQNLPAMLHTSTVNEV
jgi:hypothetical protein